MAVMAPTDFAPTDFVGVTIPSELRAAFQQRPAAMAALGDLRASLARVIETQRGCSDATGRVNWEVVQKQVTELHDNLVALLPYAVCVNCLNSELFKHRKLFDPRCVCRGYGWLTEPDYRRVHKRMELLRDREV